MTITELAEQVGISVSAAQHRLQRLRDDRVIWRDVSLMDRKRVGANVTLLAELERERDRPEF